jgi:hypothetical protein
MLGGGSEEAHAIPGIPVVAHPAPGAPRPEPSASSPAPEPVAATTPAAPTTQE